MFFQNTATIIGDIICWHCCDRILTYDEKVAAYTDNTRTDTTNVDGHVNWDKIRAFADGAIITAQPLTSNEFNGMKVPLELREETVDDDGGLQLRPRSDTMEKLKEMIANAKSLPAPERVEKKVVGNEMRAIDERVSLSPHGESDAANIKISITKAESDQSIDSASSGVFIIDLDERPHDVKIVRQKSMPNFFELSPDEAPTRPRYLHSISESNSSVCSATMTHKLVNMDLRSVVDKMNSEDDLRLIESSPMERRGRRRLLKSKSTLNVKGGSLLTKSKSLSNFLL